MTNQSHPPGLLELANIEKDTEYSVGLLQHYRKDFEKALGYELIRGNLGFDSFLMAVKEDVMNQRKLAEAFRRSPASAIAVLTVAAQCKLLPGTRYGKFYLIPRTMNRKVGTSWQKIPEVTHIIGYKGLAEMAQRHPRVHKVEAFVVYEGEEFDWEPGSGKIHHKWNPKCERVDEAIVAAYSRVVITEPEGSKPVLDDPIVWAMTRNELLDTMRNSEAWKSAERGWQGEEPRRDSPWHKHFAAQCRKTPLRRSLSNGSVPSDMGLGGVLQIEDADSRVDEPLPLPKQSQGAAARAVLGLDDPSPRFEFAEDAIQAIRAAEDRKELEALIPGWAHLTGFDAEDVARVYEERRKELG
jgi:phage RecT family recombinase